MLVHDEPPAPQPKRCLRGTASRGDGKPTGWLMRWASPHDAPDCELYLFSGGRKGGRAAQGASYRELKRSYGVPRPVERIQRLLLHVRVTGFARSSRAFPAHAEAATYGGPGPADCWAASLHGPRGLG